MGLQATIGAPPPAPTMPFQVAALEVAIDAAVLALQGNFAALLQLQYFSDVFLHYQVPATVPDLIAAIQSLYPLTNVLGLASIDAGTLLAQSILKNKLTI